MLAAVAILVWLVAATGGAQPQMADGADPAPPWPTSDPPPSGDPAVDAAAAFLVRAGPTGANDLAVILDHLDRRYDLAWAAPVTARARWQAGGPGSLQATLFARVYDAGAAVPLSPAEMTLQRTDQLTSTALHCDRWPLPDDYVDRVERFSTRRGLSDKTHALIAAIWAHEHRCIDDAEYTRLVDLIAPQLVQGIQQRSKVDDPFVESVALLNFAGRGDLVDPAWITAIRDAQRPDGGWKEDPEAERSSSHTTFLALWVLLQADHPDAAPVSWIRDP